MTTFVEFSLKSRVLTCFATNRKTEITYYENVRLKKKKKKKKNFKRAWKICKFLELIDVGYFIEINNLPFFSGNWRIEWGVTHLGPVRRHTTHPVWNEQISQINLFFGIFQQKLIFSCFLFILTFVAYIMFNWKFRLVINTLYRTFTKRGLP